MNQGDAGAAEDVTPASLRPTVARVVRLVEGLQGASGVSLEGSGPLSALSAPDRSSVVSVLGEAGSGKTTILRHAVSELGRSHERIVLPILSPERFAPGDTLAGWTLAALQLELRASHGEVYRDEFEHDGRARGVAEHVGLLRRQEALSRAGLRETATAAGAGTADQLAVNLAAVTTAGLELLRGFFGLLDYLSCTTTATVRQLVIPVDDADQNPAALPELLQDVRWLTVHPAVAVILCANEQALSAHLARSPVFATTGGKRARRAAGAALVKALPRQFRSTAESLTLEARLRFAPIGHSESIRDQLDRIALPAPHPLGLRTLADFFVVHIGNSEATSSYAELLPGNPRRLEQLFFSLEDAVEAPSEHMAGDAVALLLEAAIDEAQAQDGRVPDATMEIRRPPGGRPSIRAHVEMIDSGIRAGTGVAIYRDDDRFVVARRHDGFYAQPAGSEHDERERAYPPGFAFAHRFLLDVGPSQHLLVPPIDFEGQTGNLTNPGSGNWRATVGSRWKGESITEVFLAVPDWETFVDYVIYVPAWNMFVDAIGSYTRDREATDERLLAYLVWTHLRLVGSIQRDRRLPGDLVPGSEADLDAALTMIETDEPWLHVQELLAESVPAEDSHTTVRDLDYASWIAGDLVAAADRAFVSAELSSRVLAVRRAALASRSEDPDVDGAAVQLLVSRIQRNLGASWVTLTISTLAEFDRAAARELRDVQALGAAQESRDDQAIADMLADRHIPASVIGRMMLEGITKQGRESLRAAGFAEQAIDVLAQRFPASVASADDEETALRVDGPQT